MEGAILVLKCNNSARSSLNRVMNWNNISMRTLLGDMFDKYERFKLILSNIAISTSSGSLGATLDDIQVSLNISGLPFINSSYDTATGNNKSSVCLTSFTYNRTALNGAIYDYDDSIYAIFQKPPNMCDIQINVLRIIDDTIPNVGAGTFYPFINFIFRIEGIPNNLIEGLKPQTRIDDRTGITK